ncbi:hypothetical protein OAJ75_04975 [Candidatus Pelagibacter sp.]|nr:hypothetical protein [Candidatus Pelagibacter sp.]
MYSIKNKKKLISICFIGFFFYIFLKVFLFYTNESNIRNITKLKLNLSFNNIDRVAHAGGGFNNMVYTNSIDSLNANLKKFNFFEIDFYFSKDNKLICTHNKKHKSLNIKQYLEINLPYDVCTFNKLSDWLKSNPNKTIITDIKDRNIDALKFISQNFDNFNTNFIPQIYKIDEYQKVKELGFDRIIFTLYKINPEIMNDEFFQKISSLKLFAITMPQNFILKGYANNVINKKIPIYTHTINTNKRFFFYKYFLGVDEIYTDWLK